MIPFPQTIASMVFMSGFHNENKDNNKEVDNVPVIVLLNCLVESGSCSIPWKKRRR